MDEIMLKYTQPVEYLIMHILPYLEVLFTTYPKTKIILHTDDKNGHIVQMMFGNNIVFKHTQSFLNLVNMQDLTVYLQKHYDLDVQLPLTKPLCVPDSHMRVKKFICVFPKCRMKDSIGNIDEVSFKDLVDKTELKSEAYETYIIGTPFERLNIRYGKDIDNIIDMLIALKYCSIFITSYSEWYYIAILCNCRNIILYDPIQIPGVKQRDFNPFNAHIHKTQDLHNNSTLHIINKMLSSK